MTTSDDPGPATNGGEGDGQRDEGESTPQPQTVEIPPAAPSDLPDVFEEPGEGGAPTAVPTEGDRCERCQSPFHTTAWHDEHRPT